MTEIRVSVEDLLDYYFLHKENSLGLYPPEKNKSRKKYLTVEYAFTWDRNRLILTGKVPAEAIRNKSILLEEKHTVKNNYEGTAPEDEQYHSSRLKLLLFLAAKRNPGFRVTGRLSYLYKKTREEKTFNISANEKELEDFFLTLALFFLKWDKEEYLWIKKRNESICRTEFPFPEMREGQERIISSVENALKGNERLFIEAATGIGKTAGVLYPAIKYIGGREEYNKIFFLTAKSSGKEIVKKTLEALYEKGIRLRTVFITAKDKVCPLPGMECDEILCPYLSDFAVKSRSAVPKLLEHGFVTEEIIREYSEKENACPFELSLDLALYADLVICDYNYVFDPGVSLKRFFKTAKNKGYILLVDEAHNLVPRGRDMYSAALKKSQGAELERLTAHIAPELHLLFRELNAVFTDWNSGFSKTEIDDISYNQKPEFIYEWTEAFFENADRFLATNRKGPVFPKLLEFYFELLHFSAVLELVESGKGESNPDYCCFVRRTGKDIEWKLFCINPGPSISRLLDKFRAAVFFSATLSPFEYFRDLFGAGEKACNIILPSPFPEKNRLYFHIPEISTKYKHREATAAQIAENILDIISAKTGNYLAFFPSYSYMLLIEEKIRQKNHNVRLHIQNKNMSDKEKLRFITDFSTVSEKTNLGLAVMGGSFGEGIDLPGEKLIGAIIAGPALSMPSPETELIKKYFDEENGRGFLYAYIIPGMIRVVQAAGRVFRTAEDKGLVALMDDRFMSKEYLKLIPPDWHTPGRPFSIPEYKFLLERFWK